MSVAHAQQSIKFGPASTSLKKPVGKLLHPFTSEPRNFADQFDGGKSIVVVNNVQHEYRFDHFLSSRMMAVRNYHRGHPQARITPVIVSLADLGFLCSVQGLEKIYKRALAVGLGHCPDWFAAEFLAQGWYNWIICEYDRFYVGMDPIEVFWHRRIHYVRNNEYSDNSISHVLGSVSQNHTFLTEDVFLFTAAYS
jgi:hypothetical protein